MRQLTDDYLSEMLALDKSQFDGDRLTQRVEVEKLKKDINIKALHRSIEVVYPRIIDLHGKTLDAAMMELSAIFQTFETLAMRGNLSRDNNYFTVITGKAGEKKNAFELGISPGGIWSRHIRSWEQLNPGSYKITIKIPKF